MYLREMYSVSSSLRNQ